MHMMTNVQFCLLISEVLVPIIEFQDNDIRTHFASVMTLNN